MSIMWIAVDSSGSIKPPDSPSAMQFFTQARRIRPIRMGITRGSAPFGARSPRCARNSSRAASSVRCALE